MGATNGQKQTLWSHCVGSVQHLTHRSSSCVRLGLGKVSLLPALSRWTLLCEHSRLTSPQLTRCPRSLHGCTEAEEMAGTSQKKWDFVVIALTCLEPSEVSAGGFKKHSTFPLSWTLQPQGEDIPCWENQSLHLLFLSVLTIINSYHKAKSCQGWLSIITIKQNQKTSKKAHRICSVKELRAAAYREVPTK